MFVTRTHFALFLSTRVAKRRAKKKKGDKVRKTEKNRCKAEHSNHADWITKTCASLSFWGAFQSTKKTPLVSVPEKKKKEGSKPTKNERSISRAGSLFHNCATSSCRNTASLHQKKKHEDVQKRKQLVFVCFLIILLHCVCVCVCVCFFFFFFSRHLSIVKMLKANEPTNTTAQI